MEPKKIGGSPNSGVTKPSTTIPATPPSTPTTSASGMGSFLTLTPSKISAGGSFKHPEDPKPQNLTSGPKETSPQVSMELPVGGSTLHRQTRVKGHISPATASEPSLKDVHESVIGESTVGAEIIRDPLEKIAHLEPCSSATGNYPNRQH